MVYDAEAKGKGRKLPRYLFEDQVCKMFSLAKNSPRDLKILKFLYYFGLRSNEFRNLKKGNVDIERKVISVIEGAKNSKSRLVPIIETLIEGEGTIFQDLTSWTAGDREDYVIQGGDAEGLISNRHIRRVVKNYATWAKIENASEIHPHTLRHSYCTHLFHLEVPDVYVKDLMGHENLATTMIYTHLDVERLRKSVEYHINIHRKRKELQDMVEEIKACVSPPDRERLERRFMVKGMEILLGI